MATSLFINHGPQPSLWPWDGLSYTVWPVQLISVNLWSSYNQTAKRGIPRWSSGHEDPTKAKQTNHNKNTRMHKIDRTRCGLGLTHQQCRDRRVVLERGPWRVWTQFCLVLHEALSLTVCNLADEREAKFLKFKRRCCCP